MKQLNQTLECTCNWKRVLLNTTLIVLIVIGFFACPVTKAENAVMEAYNLRINGQVDKAKTLLWEFISKNPDNALANYELARTCLYMATGDIKNLKQHLDDAEVAIKKATDLDPDNIIYLYFSSRITFMKSYMSLQTDPDNARDHIAKICNAIEAVLELRHDYGEAILNLVEIYGGLPEEMGGDPIKAEEFASKLEIIDVVMGAKGRAILMPEKADHIEFWKEIVEKSPGNASALEELGKVYLREGKTDEGIKYLEQAINIDPSKKILLLDIARYYIFSMRKDSNQKISYILPAKDVINRYLSLEPIPPLKAYAKGLLAKLYYMEGNSEQGDKLIKEAKVIDNYVSKASAIPHPDLFIKPEVEAHNHTYLFQPL